MDIQRGRVLGAVETHWECPSCRHQDTTTNQGPHTRYHRCPSMYGMAMPMVVVTDNEAGNTGARHVLVEREDVIGDAVGVVTTPTGRPIMATRLERDDGSNDLVVYPATATSGN